MIEEAIAFATQAHKGQFRDGDHPLPYVCHPIEVMTNLRWVGGVTAESELVAALLHDVLEECPAVLSEYLQRAFGAEVLARVREVTRREPTAEETNGLSDQARWQLRSNILLAEIAEMSPEGQTLKLADRLSNIREAKLTRNGKRKRRYFVQTQRILEIIPKSVNEPLWKAVNAELPRKLKVR